MWNKIVMITAALAVMMALTGIAAATPGGGTLPTLLQIDPSSSNPNDVTFEIWYWETTNVDSMKITIYKDVAPIGSLTAADLPTSDLQVDWNNDGSSWATPVNGTQFSVGSGGYNPWNNIYYNTPSEDDTKYVKNLKIRNIAGSPGDYYLFRFEGKNIIEIEGQIVRGSGTVIPEFATVAIPIAAVLGLVFFFQQRKNKKE